MNETLQWSLEAVADADREWLVSIDQVPFIIGRADECNLKLKDERVSRQHIEIRISSDLLWIRDLDSTNGTIVNDAGIDQAELLKPDDIVSIGKYKFKVKRAYTSTPAFENDTIAATLTKELGELDAIEPKLKRLLSDRNVNPHFQPIVRFSDKSVVGYEILGRIADGDLPSNPSELLDLAEWLGCSSDLSSLFREVGVGIGKHLPGSPLLFVNTTQLEILEMEALLASLQRIRDINPVNKIVLEINEKAAAETNEISRLLDALEKMDIELAFDDFGIGQTRLVELADMPPNYLKFDISLIRQIHLAPKRLHQMISTFVKASHDLGILTLAEGVECFEEAEVCRQLGFDLAQGYFFGRPAPINAIEINSEYRLGARCKDMTPSLKTD